MTDTNYIRRQLLLDLIRTFRKTYAPKRYNDSDKKEINLFIGQANNFHPTIKFTAEISVNETSYYYHSCYHSSTRVLPVVPREQCR